jgi:Rel/ankyrin family protein
LSVVAELPYLRIIEQPVEKFRFRYKSEMMGTHGSILGRSSDKNRKKTYPTVKVSLTNWLVAESEY